MSDKKIVRVMHEHPDRVVTAVDLSEEVDMTSAGILQRLHELHDRGIVTKKRVGSRAVIWWVNESQASESLSLPCLEHQ